MTDFEVEGVKRGFKFGTYTFKLINQLAGTKTVEDVFNKLAAGEQDFASTFYFACAKHWSMFNKADIDFDEVHVTEWVENLGAEKMSEITKELLEIYITKNLKAPETGRPVPQSSNGVI